MKTFDQLLEYDSNAPGPQFVKPGGLIKPVLKDFRRSQSTKHQWHNPFRLKKGIRNWHGSTEGKVFHRKLGRFLITRPNAGKSTTFDGLLEAFYGSYYEEQVLRKLLKGPQHASDFNFPFADLSLALSRLSKRGFIEYQGSSIVITKEGRKAING